MGVYFFFQQQSPSFRNIAVSRVNLISQGFYVIPLAFSPGFISGIEYAGIGLFHAGPGNVFPQFPAKKIVRVLCLKARPAR
ncbi:MAG: hypothetical protein P4L51_24355 [Puia sp.]|nr:hypothetical protein [Puia sp.]